MQSPEHFIENAQRIFDVARSDGSAEPKDFALLIRPDGGLHVLMESPEPLDSPILDSAARARGAQIAYRVTTTGNGGVRVTGRCGGQQCVLEQQSGSRASLLRDQPLYVMISPVTLLSPV